MQKPRGMKKSIKLLVCVYSIPCPADYYMVTSIRPLRQKYRNERLLIESLRYIQTVRNLQNVYGMNVGVILSGVDILLCKPTDNNEMFGIRIERYHFETFLSHSPVFHRYFFQHVQDVLTVGYCS